MRKFENPKKKTKIKEINEYITLDDKDDRLSLRCKFNFHYFSPEYGGQDFKDWETEEKEELWDRLKTYSEDSLESWKSKKKLVIYGNFPTDKTKFKMPKIIPIDAKWGRFRFNSKKRLVGFVVSKDEIHPQTKYHFDKNTFYVVFLDKEHEFYTTEKK